MTIAQLPDGRNIEFPPEMQDMEIDKIVHSIMGLNNEGEQQKMALLSGIVSALQSLVQVMQQKDEAVVQSVQSINQELQSLTQAVYQLSARDVAGELAPQLDAIRQSNQSVLAAVSSPREVITPDGRRFISTVKETL